MNKLIAMAFKYLHMLILAYGVYNGWTQYESIVEEKDGLESQVARKKRDLESKTKEVTKLSDYFADVQTAKENIEKVAQELENLQKKLPTDNSDTATLVVIEELAKKVNLQKISISPEAIEQNMGFYLIRSLNFKATGTFLQFLFLLESIGNHERLFNMPLVKVSRSSEQQKGRFQLVNMEMKIDAYRYNPEHKEDTGIKAIEDKFKSSLNTDASAAKPAPARPAHRQGGKEEE
jgi:Tfp pilus assembly protein PilO